MTSEVEQTNTWPALVTEAKKIAGVEGWHPWLFEKVTGGVLCIGAVCPLIKKGPNQGKPNYRKHDRTTVQKVFVPGNGGFGHA